MIIVRQQLPMFATVEIFGGVKYSAALVSSAEINGVPMLAVTARMWNDNLSDRAGEGVWTKYYGHAAIFSITPLWPSRAVEEIGNAAMRAILEELREEQLIYTNLGKEGAGLTIKAGLILKTLEEPSAFREVPL